MATTPAATYMKTIDLIRDNLRQSEEICLSKIEDMRHHCFVYPTPNGGCHTMWILGHLAFIEELVTRVYMMGQQHPMLEWEDLFDGAEVSGNVASYPSFDVVLNKCRLSRTATMLLLETLTEEDLDKKSAQCPPGVEDLFGTYRRCLQYVANHWFMHRGQLADARRAAGIDRMWY